MNSNEWHIHFSRMYIPGFLRWWDTCSCWPTEITQRCYYTVCVHLKEHFLSYIPADTQERMQGWSGGVRNRYLCHVPWRRRMSIIHPLTCTASCYFEECKLQRMICIVARFHVHNEKHKSTQGLTVLGMYCQESRLTIHGFNLIEAQLNMLSSQTCSVFSS